MVFLYCEEFVRNSIPQFIVKFILTFEEREKKAFHLLSFKTLYILSVVISGGSSISPRWGRQLSGGAPTYGFEKISQKLHEIERIWTVGGRPSRPLRSPLVINLTNV